MVQATHSRLAWVELWGIGICCFNVLVLRIALPPIYIRTFLSIGVEKVPNVIGYSCPCYETLETMHDQFGKISLLKA